MTEALTVDVVDSAGKKTGSVELPAEVFDAPLNIPLMHQVVVGQLVAARQGTHATKTRGDVRGGGRKPFRQKGTGRARQGSIRAPHYTGGGTVHGPQPRDYAQRTEGKTNGSVDLPAEIFDTEASIALMHQVVNAQLAACLLYTSPSPRDATLSRMPSSA